MKENSKTEVCGSLSKSSQVIVTCPRCAYKITSLQSTRCPRCQENLLPYLGCEHCKACGDKKKCNC